MHSTYVSSAISDLQNKKQKPGEDEQEYSKRIEDGVRLCGSVHGPEDVVTMYIDGLGPKARTAVQMYKENHC